MGADAEASEAGAVDVSAEGTLVWLRRPNGTWWPSIVISPLDVPDGCPPPPRCPAVPIMLLGRRDGTTYVDWCNLARCKRVKPFRCGELDLEQRIAKAKALAASRLHHKGRYARMEDAVLQALEIERARALHSLSPKKKRKTPNDSDDDAPPKGSRRMRDLSDLSSAPPPGLSNALASHLPTVLNHAKRSKHTHATAKRKQVAADLDHPRAASRKKDRSRPLSELCNGDTWNGFSSNGQTAHGHLKGLDATSSTSTLAASLSPRRGVSKTDGPNLTQVASMNGILSHDSPRFDDSVKATHLAAANILEPDHLPTSQPFASPKYPTWRHPKQTTDCSKADISSLCESDNFKVKPIGSVRQVGSNRTRNPLGHKHHKTNKEKQKAPGNEVVLLEKKPDKLTLSKPGETGGNMHLGVFPADLDCVGAVQQQHSERIHDLGESSGTIGNSSNRENGSVSSLVFELPLETLPHPHPKRAPGLERCHAVKPIKTLQLNPTLYDVELSAQGIKNNGRRVPLVSLMSKWNHKPVVGYPISVEVSDDVFHSLSSNMDDHQPATSTADGLPKKCKAGGLPSSHACRAKPKSLKKTSRKEADKLWQPHMKKATLSPRKMRRLSSFSSSQKDGNARKSVVGKIYGPTIACIPLRVVFSRIKEALSYPAK